jgi:hypothetical protein
MGVRAGEAAGEAVFHAMEWLLPPSLAAGGLVGNDPRHEGMHLEPFGEGLPRLPFCQELRGMETSGERANQAKRRGGIG